MLSQGKLDVSSTVQMASNYQNSTKLHPHNGRGQRNLPTLHQTKWSRATILFSSRWKGKSHRLFYILWWFLHTTTTWMASLQLSSSSSTAPSALVLLSYPLPLHRMWHLYCGIITSTEKASNSGWPLCFLYIQKGGEKKQTNKKTNNTPKNTMPSI